MSGRPVPALWAINHHEPRNISTVEQAARPDACSDGLHADGLPAAVENSRPCHVQLVFSEPDIALVSTPVLIQCWQLSEMLAPLLSLNSHSFSHSHSLFVLL